METLRAVAASAGLTPGELIGYLSFALGVANVALIVRRSIWNYAFGIGSVTAALFVLYESRLYAEAALQIFFIVANVYGWMKWSSARREAGGIVVLVMTPAQRLLWSFGILAAAVSIGWALERFTDAALPYPDALIAAASIAAQILLALRKFENWILWILVDLVAVPLYFSRGIEPLAALYVIFLALSVAGLIAWRRVLRSQDQQARLDPRR